MTGGTGSIENEVYDVEPFTEGLWRMVSAPYLIPTLTRKWNNQEYNITFSSKKEKAKYKAGLVTGVLMNTVQAIGYPFVAFCLETPEIFALPLVSNLASGIYEGVRKLKDKSF